VERSYNTEIAVLILVWQDLAADWVDGKAASITMDKFEEFGRRIEEELTRLRRFVEEEVAPETEKRTASFLRDVSSKLSEAASKLEARQTARGAADLQKPQDPPSPPAAETPQT
jgi:hypothetical protein